MEGNIFSKIKFILASPMNTHELDKLPPFLRELFTVANCHLVWAHYKSILAVFHRTLWGNLCRYCSNTLWIIFYSIWKLNGSYLLAIVKYCLLHGFLYKKVFAIQMHDFNFLKINSKFQKIVVLNEMSRIKWNWMLGNRKSLGKKGRIWKQGLKAQELLEHPSNPQDFVLQ